MEPLTKVMTLPWEPPPGRLIVRTVLSEFAHHVEFCYRDGPVNRLRVIAGIRNWRSESMDNWFLGVARGACHVHFGDRWWPKCLEKAVCSRTVATPLGPPPGDTLIVRRLATEGDVQALVRLWRPHGTPEEWLQDVSQMCLCDEDKAMIARAVAARGER